MKKILMFPVSIFMAILAGIRALIDGIFCPKIVLDVVSNQSQFEEVDGVKTMEKAKNIDHAVQSLENENRLSIGRFQTLFFCIEEIRVVACDRAEIHVIDVAGGSHFWDAGIDEMGVLVCDERMPVSLIHAIRNTDMPASTLSELTRLIQIEVDIQVTELHRNNRLRLLAIPAMLDASTTHTLGFAQ